MKAARWLAPALIVIALVALWQLLAKTGVLANALNLDEILVPPPSDVGSALWENRSLLLDNAWVTLKEILLGFVLAAAIGLAFAVLLHVFEPLRRAFYPLLVASQTIPPVAIAPILVVWFGFGAGPKVALVALICFFPITVNTLDGLRSVDAEAVKMMRTLDASRLQIFQRVEAPSALPYAFSGAKIAAAVAVIAAVFGEFSGASSGLGHMILQDSSQLETARMFAAVVLLSALAILLFGLIALLQRVVVTWK